MLIVYFILAFLLILVLPGTASAQTDEPSAKVAVVALDARDDTTSTATKQEPQWGSSTFGRYPKLYFSGGAGFTTDITQVPIIFSHWEGALGLSGPLPFDLLYRGEISQGANPFHYAGLNYTSNLRMQSIALRCYPIDNFFLSVGYGLARIGTDSAVYTAGALNGSILGSSSDQTPVISVGAGYCGGYFFAEIRENFGIRNIRLYDQKPVALEELAIAAGFYFRIGPP